MFCFQNLIVLFVLAVCFGFSFVFSFFLCKFYCKFAQSCSLFTWLCLCICYFLTFTFVCLFVYLSIFFVIILKLLLFICLPNLPFSDTQPFSISFQTWTLFVLVTNLIVFFRFILDQTIFFFVVIPKHHHHPTWKLMNKKMQGHCHRVKIFFLKTCWAERIDTLKHVKI